MQGLQTSYLCLRDIACELSEFELQAFFSCSAPSTSCWRDGAAAASSWAWHCRSASRS
jgi:hypothetical protein